MIYTVVALSYNQGGQRFYERSFVTRDEASNAAVELKKLKTSQVGVNVIIIEQS